MEKREVIKPGIKSMIVSALGIAWTFCLVLWWAGLLITFTTYYPRIIFPGLNQWIAAFVFFSGIGIPCYKIGRILWSFFTRKIFEKVD